jgi:hypothetical protein
MYCYTQVLTEEQEKILEIIKDTQNYQHLKEQFTYICNKLELSQEKLVYKLIHLCNDGFIINEKPFQDTNLKLGIGLTLDGYVSLSDNPMILTSFGLGYLKTDNFLEEIIKKASNETNPAPSVINRIWQEVKDSGVDFMVKLTKEYISNPK